MSKYDKELDTRTKEYDEATKGSPIGTPNDGERAPDREGREHDVPDAGEKKK
jgi:hypothetical protein